MRLSKSDSTPPAGPKNKILRLKGGVRKTLYVCSECIEWVYTHWEGRRSIPCTEPHEECRGHRLELPRRAKGYLYAYVVEDRRYAFVELTPTAGEQFDQHYGKGARLRGARFTLQRGNGDKAHLVLEFQSPMENPSQLLPSKSVEPTLRQLWGMAASETVSEDRESLPFNEAI